MAANSDPTKCTHPNTATKSTVEGGYAVPRLGGTNADGSFRTERANKVSLVRYNCPDCGWELRRGLDPLPVAI